VTYFDSSYTVIAHEVNADLVTDDERLKRKVREGREELLEPLGKEVAVHSSRDLIKS